MTKRSIRISFIAVIMALTGYGLFTTVSMEDSGDVSASFSTPGLLIHNKDALPEQLLAHIPPDKQAAMETAFTPYRKRLTELFSQIQHNGDMANYQTMRYEDDWCMVTNDLVPEDKALYRQDRDEWLLSRGLAFSNDPNTYSKRGIPGDLGERNQHLIPYEEMPLDELKQRADNNDFYALIVLGQNPGKYWKESKEINSKLVLLGDTSMGLANSALVQIDEALNHIKQNQTAQAYSKTYKAFTFAEYGLLRGDMYAMESLSLAIEKNSNTPEGQRLQEIAASLPSQNLKVSALDFLEKLNQTRTEMLLPPFDTEALPKAAQAFQLLIHTDFQQKHQNTLNADWFPKRWQEEYAPMTLCRERYIKQYQFDNEQEPAIFAEIETMMAKFQ